MAKDPRAAVEAFLKSVGADEAFALATVVRTKDATSAKAGAKAVITGEGEVIGWVGSNCVQGAVRKVGREVLEKGGARLIRIKPKDEVASSHDEDGVELHKSGCPSRGSSDIFIEAVIPRPQLVICGNSYVARALGELGQTAGYDIVHAAPGLKAGDESGRRQIDDFEFSACARLEQSFWVVATQGARDRDGLKAALAQPSPYVAFVGSRRKMKKLKTDLLAEGVDADRLERVICPAGLDLGAFEPAEIALTILAQILQLRRQGKLAGDTDSERAA